MVDSTTQNEGSNEQQEDEDVLDLFAENADEQIVPATVEGTEDTDVGAGGQQTQAGEDEGIPEKYKGKSITDVIDMHQNLERVYGRHNNELGELRKLTDEILQQQLKGATSQNSPDDNIDRDDLLDNPESTINSAVEKSSKVLEIEARLDSRERAEQLAAFNGKHPDADKVLADPRFAEWLQKSPTRVRLFQQADKTYDYDLAGELISTFSEMTATQTDAGEADRTATKRSLRTPKANAGSTTGSGKKLVFKRADLMKLKATDPKRYERLQPQILEAYAEGRVR